MTFAKNAYHDVFEWLLLLLASAFFEFFLRKNVAYDVPLPWIFYCALGVLFFKLQKPLVLFIGAGLKATDILLFSLGYEAFVFWLFFVMGCLFFKPEPHASHAFLWQRCSLVLGVAFGASLGARLLQHFAFQGLSLGIFQFLLSVCFVPLFLFLFFEETAL